MYLWLRTILNHGRATITKSHILLKIHFFWSWKKRKKPWSFKQQPISFHRTKIQITRPLQSFLIITPLPALPFPISLIIWLPPLKIPSIPANSTTSIAPGIVFYFAPVYLKLCVCFYLLSYSRKHPINILIDEFLANTQYWILEVVKLSRNVLFSLNLKGVCGNQQCAKWK